LATYNNVPLTLTDVKKLKFDDAAANDIIAFLFSNFKKTFGVDWKEAAPIAAQKVKANSVKIRYAYDLTKLQSLLKKQFPEYDVTKASKSVSVKKGRTVVLKFEHGEGSRNKKAGGGKAGLKFEQDLAQDLQAYPDNTIVKKHKKIVDEIYSILKSEYQLDLMIDDYDVIIEGDKNKKRRPSWDEEEGVRFNPSGDIGHIVTDVTVKTKNKQAFLSLKYTSQFYMINASVAPYLHFNRPDVDVPERNKILRYFGFNPKDFCAGYEMVSDDNAQEPDSKIKSNWAKILKEVIGNGYIYVVGGGTHDIVINTKTTPIISIASINDRVYAIPNKRKYSKIGLTAKIDGRTYNLDCQFRGTTATDVYPKYLRVLVKTK